MRNNSNITPGRIAASAITLGTILGSKNLVQGQYRRALLTALGTTAVVRCRYLF